MNKWKKLNAISMSWRKGFGTLVKFSYAELDLSHSKSRLDRLERQISAA